MIREKYFFYFLKSHRPILLLINFFKSLKPLFWENLNILKKSIQMSSTLNIY